MRMGNPILYQKAKPVTNFNTPELNQLIADMWETMETLGGVGIAAPQVGESLQLAVFGFEKSPRYGHANAVPKTVLINPKIESLSDEMYDDWEGCMSIRIIRGLVPRYKKIRYSGYNEKGEFFQHEVEGFHAKMVQHEYDHLIGRLFPSRIKDMQYLGFEEELADIAKKVGTRLP